MAIIKGNRQKARAAAVTTLDAKPAAAPQAPEVDVAALLAEVEALKAKLAGQRSAEGPVVFGIGPAGTITFMVSGPDGRKVASGWLYREAATVEDFGALGEAAADWYDALGAAKVAAMQAEAKARREARTPRRA